MPLGSFCVCVPVLQMRGSHAPELSCVTTDQTRRASSRRVVGGPNSCPCPLVRSTWGQAEGPSTGPAAGRLTAAAAHRWLGVRPPRVCSAAAPGLQISPCAPLPGRACRTTPGLPPGSQSMQPQECGGRPWRSPREAWSLHLLLPLSLPKGIQSCF